MLLVHVRSVHSADIVVKGVLLQQQELISIDILVVICSDNHLISVESYTDNFLPFFLRKQMINLVLTGRFIDVILYGQTRT